MTQNLDAIWRNFKSTVYNSIVVFIWFRETLLPADLNEILKSWIKLNKIFNENDDDNLCIELYSQSQESARVRV